MAEKKELLVRGALSVFGWVGGSRATAGSERTPSEARRSRGVSEANDEACVPAVSQICDAVPDSRTNEDERRAAAQSGTRLCGIEAYKFRKNRPTVQSGALQSGSKLRLRQSPAMPKISPLAKLYKLKTRSVFLSPWPLAPGYWPLPLVAHCQLLICYITALK